MLGMAKSPPLEVARPEDERNSIIGKNWRYHRRQQKAFPWLPREVSYTEPRGVSSLRNVRRYWLTVSSTSYDKASGCARTEELYAEAARHGRIETVRKRLADIGVPFFQRVVYRRLKKWIPKREVKVGFEREEVAEKSRNRITTVGRSLEYRGKQRRAYLTGEWVLSYARKRRKRKSS